MIHHDPSLQPLQTHDPLIGTERLRLYGLEPSVCENIRRHRHFLLSVVPEALDGFYRRIGDFEETRRFFRDADHIAYMKAVQMRHWQRLTDAQFDEAYAQEVMRIGETHYNVGVPPKLYIAFYNVLLIALADLIAAQYADAFPEAGPSGQFTLMKDLTRVLMYDMECAITVYVERSNSLFI
ncbi:MAG: protoglobin domain-containing protein [Asticcacaulis sp.]